MIIKLTLLIVDTTGKLIQLLLGRYYYSIIIKRVKYIIPELLSQPS